MKINYTMIGAGKTGGSIVLSNIMNKLAERGHQVTITLPRGTVDWLSPKVKQITPLDSWTRVNLLAFGAAYIFLKKIMKKDFYLNIYRVLDILERITPDCDINVATYCFTAFPVLRSGKGIPFYHMQHYEELFFADPHLKALAKETYYLPLNKIANSVWLKNQIKERFGQDVPVVNPGINLNIFKPRKDKEAKGSKKRVVCYGSNTDWKGFKDAVEAMKIVFKERKDVEWIVFGLAPLKVLDAEAPYTFIKGIFNEKLAELYSSADVVFCPSWYESFPLPPLEAMACGAPLVTTRYGTEDYCFHEDNSLVVPPREPKLMAEAILRLLEDKNLASRQRENGLKTAREFTWDKTVDKVESLFKQKLQGSG
ncbi:glycosyltransferase family 4 protein [Dehalococcoidia bacterium]|nr:glycosyltransferase family 4 protein [Dehalococcoidia bacterium]